MENLEPISEARPSYAERRKAQLAAGAPRISKKKCNCKIKVLWTECRPPEYIEDDEGNLTRIPEGNRFMPNCFRTEADANAANERFRACHGYAEEVFWCAVHGRFHLRHIYSNHVRKQEPEQTGQPTSA